MAESLFDVVAFDVQGIQAAFLVQGGTELPSALSCCRGFNESGNERWTACVVPAGSIDAKPQEPLSFASNALDDDDDSTVDDGTEDAAESIVAYDLEENASRNMRLALYVHLEHVYKAVEHVRCCGDIGVIARSLEALAEVFGGESEYRSGATGSWENEKLTASLGFDA